MSRALEPVTAHASALEQEERPRELQCKALSILVAEDNPVNQRVIRCMLEKYGHAVSVVNHGGEAVEALEHRTFDAILMDIQMPVLDGYRAATLIRSKEPASGSPRVPIIALTARAMAGDREKCLAAGMDGYLSKPINPAALVNILDSLTSGLRIEESSRAC